jgi:hypothetical protein
MADTPRDRLNARKLALEKNRAEVQAQCDAQLARIDTQITTCANLLANWDRLTVDQALAGLAQTGVNIRFD